MNYIPEKYWSERAKRSQGEIFKAVCVDNIPEIENRSADALQTKLMKWSIATASLNPGSRVLEFGCGAGRWYAFFAKRRDEWYGVDISADMLDLASSRCDASRLSKTDGINILHPDSSFDLVYSVTVLHHNEYEDQEKILVEMMRVLKPGGILILYEDLDVGAKSFNMFPRTISGWIEPVQKLGANVIDHKEVRYWPFRAFFSRLARRNGSEANKDSRIRAIIGWIDYLFANFVQPIFPQEKMSATSIVFKKVGKNV